MGLFSKQFNWAQSVILQGTDSALGVLGSQGNFFASLPNVLKGAIVMDLETAGIGPRQPILEAAIKDIATGGETTYYIAPTRIVNGRMTPMTDESQLNKIAQPWSAERMKTGQQFDYVNDYFNAVKSQKNRTLLKSQGYLDISTRTGTKRFRTMENFFTQFSSDIKGKPSLLAANLQFESKQMGYWFQHLPEQQQKSIREMFHSYSPKSKRFLFSDIDIGAVKSVAFQRKDAQGWIDVAEKYWNLKSVSGIVTGDIQDPLRGMLARAKKAGVVSTSDFFTGIAMNTTGMSMGLLRATGEAHTALADTELQVDVLKRAYGIDKNIASLEQKGLTSFLSNIRGLVSGDLLRSTQTVQRIESIQPMVKEMRLKQQLAHLELERRLAKFGPESIGGELDPFKISSTTRSIDIETVVKDVGTVDQRIHIPSEVPLRNSPNIEKAIGQYVNDMPKTLLQGGYPDLEKRIPSLIEEYKSLPVNQLWELYQPTTDPEKAAAISRSLYETISGAKVWNKLDVAKASLKAHPVGYGGLAIAGLVVGNAILGAISGKDDTYNTIEGLKHGGLASQYRQSYAFGSGWLGLDSMIDLGPQYDPNVYSNIAELRRNRSSLEERTQSSKDASGQEAKAQFTTGDFLSSNLSQSVVGINKNNRNVQEIDLSRFSVDVEDADTLVLNRKGISSLWSKPLTVRLAGIDAPEITHPGQEANPLKTGQEQPGGRRSKQVLESIIASSNKLQLLVDPTNTTYGRSLGVLVADDVNVNLAMVAKGMVSSLEYGPRSKDITDRDVFRMFGAKAESTRQGIWQLPFYRAIRQYNAGAGRDITFNSLTDVVRMAEDPTIEALYTAAWTNMAPPGMTYQLGKASRIRGRGGDYNSISGLTHSGMASELRQLNTDFGSPWQGLLKALSKFSNLFRKPEVLKDGSTRILSPLFGIEGLSNKAFKRITGTNAAGINISRSKASESIKNEIARASTGLFSRFNKKYVKQLSALDKRVEDLPNRLYSIGFVNLDKAQDIGVTAHEFSHTVFPRLIEDPHSRDTIQRFIKDSPDIVSRVQKSLGSSDSQLVKDELVAEATGSFHLGSRRQWNLQALMGHGYTGRLNRDQFSRLTSLGRDLHLKSTEIKQTLMGLNPNIPAADDAYNTLEGLRHGGMAELNRKWMTDFGSGFDKVKQLAKMMGMGFEDLVRSNEFRQSIERAQPIKELGHGLFGRAHLQQGSFRGQLFEFVTKTPTQKGEMTEHISQLANENFKKQVSSMSPEQFYKEGSQNLISEHSILGQLGHENPYTPSTYGLFDNKLAMEYMPGANVTHKGVKPSDSAVKEFGSFIESTAHSKGIINQDVHKGNLLYDEASKRISWIDFGAAEQLKHVTGKNSLQYTESLTRAHEALTYGMHMPSYESKLFAQQFKPLVPSTISSDAAFASTAANDDVHNTIEGITAGAGNTASRQTIGTPFGSGWHRDAGWVVNYYLSQTQNTLGQAYANQALGMTQDIVPDGIQVPGAYNAGIKHLYQMALPDTFQSASRQANLLATPNTSGQGGNSRVQTIGTNEIEAFTHSGMGGMTREYNTGFGSGWKGLESTIQANDDFGNIGGATTSTLQNHPMPTVNHQSFGYSRYVKPTITLQTKSPMRSTVDHVQTSLQNVNSNRKVKDYYRKLEMAKNQELASRSMFLNAKYGGKHHMKQDGIKLN